jgi:hypothetical protein
MTFRGTFNAGIHAPATQEHDTSTGRCKRSCCWTPFGHAARVDCTCHQKEATR